MESITLTWTLNGAQIVIFRNGVVVRRTEDNSATAVFAGGVMHAVVEPMEKVVAELSALSG